MVLGIILTSSIGMILGGFVNSLCVTDENVENYPHIGKISLTSLSHKRITTKPVYFDRSGSIGKGTYGEVFQLFEDIHCQQPLDYILKLQHESCDDFNREIENHKTVYNRYPENIVEIIPLEIKVDGRCACIMEKLDGYVSDYLLSLASNKRKFRVELDNICDVLYDITGDFKHGDMHYKNVMYKTVNTDKIVVKVIDFGFLKIEKQEQCGDLIFFLISFLHKYSSYFYPRGGIINDENVDFIIHTIQDLLRKDGVQETNLMSVDWAKLIQRWDWKGWYNFAFKKKIENFQHSVVNNM